MFFPIGDDSKASRYLCVLLLSLAITAVASKNDEISNHIRKCCLGGLRHARSHNTCDNHSYETSTTVPPLWRGICFYTYGVCCSREITQQFCVKGRLAALTGSRCEAYNTTSFVDCCRSCQVGLAVKATENNCNDPLFSYFSKIESYRICCGGGHHELDLGTSSNDSDSYVGSNFDDEDNFESSPNAESEMEAAIVKDTKPDESDLQNGTPQDFIDTENTDDGTIVLNEDDDDICGKVPNLCAHICENTKEAYQCKCHSGYKLDDNKVTCSLLNHSSGTTEDEDNQAAPTDIDERNDISSRVGQKPAEKIKDAINDDNVSDDELSLDDDIDTEVDDDEKLDAAYDESPGEEADRKTPCPTGYRRDLQQHRCVDIDECTTHLASCEPNEYCHNTIGGYRCLNIRLKSCDTGYRYSEVTKRCEDINECLENLDNCTAAQLCLNTRGSFKCKHRGHLHQSQSATDSNENSRSLSKLTSLAAQLEKCDEGFQFKHGRCIDIDECLTDKNACDSSQVCTNDIGGYHCNCKIGFNLDITTNACVDINECSINNHNCLPTQRCDNTVGSYICTRLQSCGTGYTLNAETANCDDDDECTLSTHNCPSDYECYNTKGSFRCYRRPPSTSTTTTSTTTTTTTTTTTPPPPVATNTSARGTYTYVYRNSPSYVSHQTHHIQDYAPKYVSPPCEIGFRRNYLGACVDVNECLDGTPCGSHQRCINTNGSYRCQNLLQCAAGYRATSDGTSCVDIDECLTGEHNCAENQICRNRNGGFICVCPPGHQLTRIPPHGQQRCVDVNECEQDRPQVCPSNAKCLNTIGSYYCECKSGFQKSKDNERICLDVDECQDIPGLCQQKCVNFWGGYRCTCNPGYELSPDNRTCNDVDECEVHKSYKLCMGFCNNVPGSYECSCPRGYTLTMDRTTCRDIDECASGEFCTGRHDICTNTRGSYKCTTIHCPYGYINDPDQKNRCRQSSNFCEGDDCYNKPSAYTYNFITLVNKLMIPPEGRLIFSLRGALWYDNIDFDLKIVKIQAAANIEKATDNHFDIIKSKHEVQLSLRRTLEGPQEIELELSMTVFTNGMPRGKSVAKIFILVSQYTF